MGSGYVDRLGHVVEEVDRMYCPACGAAFEQGAAYCAACGTPAPVSTGPGLNPTMAPPRQPVPVPGAFAPRPAMPPPSAAGMGAGMGGVPDPVTTIELRRLGTGDMIALFGTVVLFVSLYLPWYSLSFSDPTLGTNTTFLTTSALGAGAGGWRFLIFVMCLLIVGYLFVRTMIKQHTRRMPLPHWQLLAVLCGVNMLLTLLAFLVKPGSGATVSGVSFSWSFGAPMGLGAAVLALVGAVVRRSDPELLDSGSRYPAAPMAAYDPTTMPASTGPGSGPGYGYGYDPGPGPGPMQSGASDPTAGPGSAAAPATAATPPAASRAPRPARRSLTHHHR